MLTADDTDQLKGSRPPGPPAAIDVVDVARSFGPKQVLRDVSLAVEPGEIHAVLGPNGAGKTTLMRIVVGLTHPDTGSVWIEGEQTQEARSRDERRRVQMVPSGDRTLYLRISGIENLAFFGRLAGMSRKEALEAGYRSLEAVGLTDVAKQRVHTYSHGMQKRLSIARALLTEPPILVFDEATHDLDPPGAERIRVLIRALAAQGTAVLWATQRVDEIRGFADRVTFLADGAVRFAGSVERLLAFGRAGRYVLRLGPATPDVLEAAIGGSGTLVALADGHVALEMLPGVPLGDAIASLHAAGVSVLDCGRERSEVEAAFHALLAAEAA